MHGLWHSYDFRRNPRTRPNHWSLGNWHSIRYGGPISVAPQIADILKDTERPPPLEPVPTMVAILLLVIISLANFGFGL
jgi:hypothetical protein